MSNKLEMQLRSKPHKHLFVRTTDNKEKIELYITNGAEEIENITLGKKELEGLYAFLQTRKVIENLG